VVWCTGISRDLATAAAQFLPKVFEYADSQAESAAHQALQDSDETDKFGDGHDSTLAAMRSSSGSARIVVPQRVLERACGPDASKATVDAMMTLLSDRGVLSPYAGSRPGSRRDLYVLDTQVLLRGMVMQTVYDIMLKKFNHRFGLRIFRLLLKLKYAEEKDIGRQAMLSVRETRKTLYALLQQQFVAVQEVPKRSDRYVKHSFFLWYALLLSNVLHSVDTLMKLN